MWRASALYSIAGALGKVGALATVPAVTRALGRSDYGLLDLATALVAMATLIGGISAELPAARFASARPDRRPQVLATYVATVTMLSAAIAVVLAIAAPVIATSVWRTPRSSSLVLMSAIAIVLTAMQLASWNVHRLMARAGTYAVLSILDVALKVSLILAAVAVRGGVVGIMLAYVVVAAVGAGLGLWSIRRDIGRPLTGSLVSRLVSGGVPFTVSAVAFVVGGYGVRAIIAGAGSTVVVGEMAIGLRSASLLALPLAAFQFAWAPIGMTAGHSVASRKAFSRSILGVITIGGLAAVGLSAVSQEMVALVAGHDFAVGAGAVPGLAMSTVLNTAFFMLAVASSTAGTSMWAVAILALAGSAVQVVVTALLLAVFPAMAAISIGAVLGNAAAVGALLTLRGFIVEQATLIGTGVCIAVVITLVVQALLASGAPASVRWPIGLAALVCAGYLLVRPLRWTASPHS